MLFIAQDVAEWWPRKLNNRYWVGILSQHNYVHNWSSSGKELVFCSIIHRKFKWTLIAAPIAVIVQKRDTFSKSGAYWIKAY